MQLVTVSFHLEEEEIEILKREAERRNADPLFGDMHWDWIDIAMCTAKGALYERFFAPHRTQEQLTADARE